MQKRQAIWDRYPVGTVLVLMFLCVLPWMIWRDFTPSNELRYLSIVDEALRDGHFFAFFNQGEPYADKPPLYLWLVMFCRVLFGQHCPFVLALFSFIPAVVIVWVMDRWVYGVAAAAGEANQAARSRERMSVALILCSTIYWLGLTFFLRMDMLMVMFIVLALYAWFRNRPWLFALYTFLALFTKGPVGILMPPLTLAVYALSCRIRKAKDPDPRHRLGRFLGWRFLLLVGGLCAVWFTFAWLEGGSAYLQNLLFHQTVDRTVRATHHQQPFWYYLEFIWLVMLPWGFFTVPVCVASLIKRENTVVPQTEAARAEKLLRCAFFATFFMLSLSSSKLPVYLLPIFPFAVYLLPLYIRRKGWQRWTIAMLAVAAAAGMLIGLALFLETVFNKQIPSLAPYDFAASPWMGFTGVLVFFGGLFVLLCVFRTRGAFPEIRPLAFTIFVGFLALAPLIHPSNEFLGYGAICRDVPAGEKVYVMEDIRRPENMDVYLGQDVVVVHFGEPVPAEGVLLTRDTFSDPALEGRPHHVHGSRIIWYLSSSEAPQAWLSR